MNAPAQETNVEESVADAALSCRWRVRLINTGLVLFLLATVYEVALHREHWPLSSYPMFAGLRPRAELLHHTIIAVPADGSDPFPLYKSEHLYPFHWYRHRRGIREMLEKDNGVQLAENALRDCMRRYDEGRRVGRHHDPPLRAMQLIRVEYVFEPKAEKVIKSENRQWITSVEKNRDEQPENLRVASNK